MKIQDLHRITENYFEDLPDEERIRLRSQNQAELRRLSKRDYPFKLKDGTEVLGPVIRFEPYKSDAGRDETWKDANQQMVERPNGDRAIMFAVGLGLITKTPPRKPLNWPGMLGLKEQQYLKGFETFTLKRGTTVYHGTDSEDFDERADELQTPFWVSDSPEVAKYFGTGYQGGNKPRILTYTMTDDVNLIVIRDSEDINEIHELAGSSGDPRELADFVCSRLGYGGWIIPDNYPEGADIMLCHTDIQLQDVTPIEK